MANYEATRYDFDGANLTDIEGVNTGLIVPWSSDSIPSGFLECDGSAVSRSTYANLFAVVGTTFGVGDGSTTFNLPDLQTKTVVGRSPTTALGTSTLVTTVTCTGNVTGSAASHSLSTPELPAHTHPALARTNPFFRAQNPTTQWANLATGGAGGGGGHSHNLSANFSGSSASNVQPYLVVKYIIKT